ncbi:hypothetical protein [Nocardioides sp. R-C-SC26]|uniref:hypothetical protein n=1 Tax=Nocardioides sp. R-C-SC26 TaxID=2870414 RepID=UPI001E3517EB|nr:hypothetical protein [Nocardioides sp. R-C-SC26]
MSSRRGLIATLGITLGAAALVSLPAGVASGDDPGRDDCARTSDFRLRIFEASNNNSRLTVVGVVWSDDNDVWEWRMKHDGDVSAEGKLRAKDADRSLRIERSMINLPGPDTILFMAKNTATGEVCRTERQF